MDTKLTTRLSRFCSAASVAVILAFLPGQFSHAQGLGAKETIDTIVDAEVETTDEAAAAPEQRVIAAIEKSSDSAAEVRKRISIDNLKIVFLPGFDAACGSSDAHAAIKAKMEEFDDDITTLREAIQGSAIFYHAVNSQSILLNDIVAVEFADPNDVMVLVAGTQC